MRKLFAGAAFAAMMALAGQASAAITLFTNGTGLTGSFSTVTFDELTFPDFTLITNQYSAYGITLDNGVMNTEDGFLPRNYVSNFGDTQYPDLKITFNNTVTAAAFELVTNTGDSTFDAYLGSTLEASGVLGTGLSPAYYGFTGGSFNSIVINAPGNEALEMKNVQFSAVPEASTWAMMVLGFAGLGFAGYRKAERSRAIVTA